MFQTKDDTQGLIMKDILLDTSEEKCYRVLGNGFCGMKKDANMKYCIKHTDNKDRVALTTKPDLK
ncbi:MAG: hypothetical protein ACW9XB_08055 [Candidatus Nitrosopumilus sp. metabat.KBP569_Feb_25m_nospike.7]|nr:hypothetical protein [Nitrosopumilus sp.]